MKKNLNFLKLFYALLLVTLTGTVASCVDDNDDTEAPYLNVTPATLTFGSDGQPVSDSQNYFEISTNRDWTATVQADKSWVTISQTSGSGSAKVQVSIPAGINDEASITVSISNKVGVLMAETIVIKSGTVAPEITIFNETTGTQSVSSPYPLVGVYTGWNTTGTGASTVTYTGTNTSVRASGNSNSDAYDGASGPNAVFFGTANAVFNVNNISLTSSETNLKLTFGASYSKNENGSYINTFNPANFTVALSADGTTWTPIAYTSNGGDSKAPYWIQATANFTLKKAVSSLYIRFTATESSVYRLDDINLSTGTGGTEVDLGSGGTTPSEAKAITIPEMIAMMTNTETVLDATADRTFQAVVQNDTTGGNYSFNNLILTTQGATTQGNGITLYGSQVEPTAIKVNKGDLVKVTLLKGLANIVNYSGLYEVTGSKDATWVNIEKVGTATITPVVITPDKLADYQGMPVTIQNATPDAAGVWATTSGISSHTFTASSQNFTVFCKKGATAFVNVSYVVKTAAISGLAAVNKNAAQLVPRNIADVSAFNGTSGGGGTPSEGTSFTMTYSDIVSGMTGSNSLPTNSYGTQSVADAATWYTWKFNNIDFTGVKICVATADNGGGIQVQGNASDNTKQGRIANVTAINNMQTIVLTLKVVATSTYAPAFTLYAGSAANPATTAITPTVTSETLNGFKVYTETFDLSTGSYSYFNIMNNLAGALYVDSIKVTVK